MKYQTLFALFALMTAAVLADNTLEDRETREFMDDMQEKLNNQNPEFIDRGQRMTSESLTDLILAAVSNAKSTTTSNKPKDELVQVYEKVGLHLSRYKSGKLPKAFKVIPSLKNWQEVLQYTNPSEWTPNATYEATTVFISNLNPAMFLTGILLPKIRQDIASNKKLNPHYYNALKKAIYKPAAFFKGIVGPLCQASDCTLKEAAVVASVLAKVSIPSLHSAAGILALIEDGQRPFTGARGIFLKTLLDKRHALPCRVVDALVGYFGRPSCAEMPVMWHQALLIFVQRYKLELSSEHLATLTGILERHTHPDITPEILRELESSKSQMRD